MGYPTKVQLISREKGQQWYVNFPNALAEAGEKECILEKPIVLFNVPERGDFEVAEV